VAEAVAPVPAEAEDLYDLAPSFEPPKPVHKPVRPPVAAPVTSVPAKTSKSARPAVAPAAAGSLAGGAALAAAPVLGYRRTKDPGEKNHFTHDTLMDVRRDVYVPVTLLLAGLAMSVAYYAIHYHLPAAGVALTLLGVSAMTAFKVVLLIAFAFVISGPIGVSFGGIWTAVLKLAAIAVFSDGVTTWVDAAMSKLGAGGMELVISFPIALGIYWLLLIYLFSMDAGDSWIVVILLAVFDTIVRWAILLLLLRAVLSLGGVAGSAIAGTAASSNSTAVRLQDLQDANLLKEAHAYYTTEHHIGPLQPECEAWYAAGAKHVWYEVSRDINGKMTVGLIDVELPTDPAKRAQCYKILNDFYAARKEQFGSMKVVDKGEPYLEVWVPHF
jgi:hypothetical protein